MHDYEQSCVTKLCSNFEPSCLATAAEINVCAGLNMLMDAKSLEEARNRYITGCYGPVACKAPALPHLRGLGQLRGGRFAFLYPERPSIVTPLLFKLLHDSAQYLLCAASPSVAAFDNKLNANVPQTPAHRQHQHHWQLRSGASSWPAWSVCLRIHSDGMQPGVRAAATWAQRKGAEEMSLCLSCLRLEFRCPLNRLLRDPW